MMNIIKKILATKLLVLSALSPCSVIAASPETLQNVKIEEFRIRPQSYNSLVRFNQPFNQTCSDSGVWAMVRTDGKEGSKLAWSTLMLAYAQNKAVTVASTGVCAYHNELSEVQLHR